MPTYSLSDLARGVVLESNGVLRGVTWVAGGGYEAVQAGRGFFTLVDSGFDVPRQLINVLPHAGGVPPPGSPMMANRAIPFRALRVQSIPTGSQWTVETA
jgi:hypothetical protein